MSTQSVRLSPRTRTQLCQPSTGNMDHGVSAVSPVGQVSKITSSTF